MSEKIRTILTTDMECDDMNSLIHLALHFNDLDIAGIVYTSSQFHFQGDGVHTLGEVTPHFRCQGMGHINGGAFSFEHDDDAASVRVYRSFEDGWIEKLIRNEYAAVYENLNKNAPGYPTPEELLKIVKVGNVAFEGDVREETEGSRLIKDCILDEDERLLHIQSWGGANTIVRALMSIAEEYKDTPQWDDIYRKVCGKVRIWGIFDGVGQDNSWEDYGKPLFPDLKLMRTEHGYASFFNAFTTDPDCLYMFKGPWMKENIKYGHGPLMEKYGLWNDGTEYIGEEEIYQYGRGHSLNWGIPGMPEFVFDTYDFLGEGDSGTYVQLFQVGLRGMEDPRYGSLLGRFYEDQTDGYPDGYNYNSGKSGKANRFLKAYHEEFAARARWCHEEVKNCVHPPVIELEKADYYVQPGEVIRISAKVCEPDGRPVKYYWSVYKEGTSYEGAADELRVFDPLDLKTGFTVPLDAKPGDYFSLLLTAKADVDFPITRYGQIIVHVKCQNQLKK